MSDRNVRDALEKVSALKSEQLKLDKKEAFEKLRKDRILREKQRNGEK